MERQEADLYTCYRDWVSYGFYVARTRSSDDLRKEVAMP